MSATATEEPTSAPASPTARGLWRRGRGIVALGALVVAIAAVTALVFGTGSADGRFLDPDDTTLTGSGGLAEILRHRGVRVERVSTVDDVERLDGPGRQLLLHDTAFLSAGEVGRLARTRADRLIIGAGHDLSLLAPGVEITGEASSHAREPDCDLPAAVRAGSAYTGGATFGGTGHDAAGCYPGADGPTLVRLPGTPAVTLAGDGAFMTNKRLAEDGNAALALNLAGARPVLIWLVPPQRTAVAAGSGKADLGELIPAGVPWAVIQLGVALLAVAFWRGRRLGPVVVEPLPVVVRAAETVEGRGRLYRAHRARDRASAALRAACLSRLAPRLGLPGDATPDEIVAATVPRTGQDAVWVRSVLYGPSPADDAGLVALAGHLDTVERQVREP